MINLLLIDLVKRTYINEHKFNESACLGFLTEEKLISFAYLIGKIMGDGHLSQNYSLYFISGSKDDLVLLSKYIETVFLISTSKMRINTRKHRGTSYCLRVNYALFGRLFYCLGAPKGNKVKQSFLIPTLISSNKSFSKMFLMGILEDELSTIKIEKNNYSIEPKFKMAKTERFIKDLRLFLQQVKDSIESFGIQCSEISKEAKSKENQNTKDLYFYIKRNKRNIIKFEEKIGFFLNKDKKDKLEHCCFILRKTLSQPIDETKILFLKEQGLSIRQIANKVCHGRTTVHRIITKQQSLNKNC